MATYDKARRSLAAKKGWVTRRKKSVESGKLSPEDFFDIYGIEGMSDFPEYYKTITPEMIFESNEITEDFTSDFDEYYEEHQDEYYQNIFDISQERIENALIYSAYNVYEAVHRVLFEIKRDISAKDYITFFVDALPALDDYLGLNMYPWTEEEDTNNVISKLIDLAHSYGFEQDASEYSDMISRYVYDDFDVWNKTKRKKH